MIEDPNQPVADSPPRRPRWSTVVVALAVVGLYLFATRPAPPPEGWGTDYAVAVREAGATNRLVLVAFHTPGCPPCTVMDRTVLNQEVIKAALRNYIPVRVDANKHQQLAGLFGALATPTYAVVDGRGGLLAKCEGLQSVEGFLSFLARAGNSPSPLADPPPPSGR